MLRLILISAVITAIAVSAATTIDSTDKYAWGANVGWINAEGDVANGMVVGQAFCTGYMYGANIGWINLGDGTPDNGTAYSNASATDFGINHDGLGNLTGYAWGANIGWINFEQTYGQPKVSLATGELSGYVWSANAGWINLTGITTTSLDPGPDTDGDGIPDAWELGHTNVITVLGPAPLDSDGDGASDVDEYGADTDPFDADDSLRITAFESLASTNRVTWPVKTTRQYTLQYASSLTNGAPWSAASAAFIPSSGPDVTEEVTGVVEPKRFYKVEAEPPLAP